MMAVSATRPNPFRGEVVWLTPDQGGRVTGPPRPPYAATAYVPPETAESGLAPFVLDEFQPGVWRSKAAGRWLAVDNRGRQCVRRGALVVITEGPKPVGYFQVHEVSSGAV